MLPSVHHANTEQTASDSPDLTFYASLELSRATWLVTCLLPERDRMSKYSTPGGDGGALLGLLANKSRRRTAIPGLMAGKAGGVAGVVRGVMNHIDVRKADTPNQESAEESGKDRRDKRVRSGGDGRPGTRPGADDFRLHKLLLGCGRAASTPFSSPADREVVLAAQLYSQSSGFPKMLGTMSSRNKSSLTITPALRPAERFSGTMTSAAI